MKKLIAAILITTVLASIGALAIDLKGDMKAVGGSFAKNKINRRGALVNLTGEKIGQTKTTTMVKQGPKGANVTKTITRAKTENGTSVTSTRTVVTPKGKTLTQQIGRNVTRTQEGKVISTVKTTTTPSGKTRTVEVDKTVTPEGTQGTRTITNPKGTSTNTFNRARSA